MASSLSLVLYDHSLLIVVGVQPAIAKTENIITIASKNEPTLILGFIVFYRPSEKLNAKCPANTLSQDNVPYDYTQKNRHCLHFYKILLRISTEKQHFYTFRGFFLNKLRFHTVKLLHAENFGEDFKRSGAVFALNRNARLCSGNKLCLSAQSNEQVGNLR